MGRRSAAISVLSCVFLLTVLAPPASAGGGSTLEVVDASTLRLGPWSLDHASVGDTVVMRTDFYTGQYSPVRAGPWYAYLTPVNGDDRSEPILLAPIDITRTGSHSYIASVGFTAPQVPTDHYSLQVCDLGCHLIGVGDLYGGNLVIGATTSEARLFARTEIMGWRLDAHMRRIQSLSKQRDELRSEASTGARALRDARSAAHLASLRAERVDAEAEEAARRHGIALGEAERRVTTWRLLAGALLLACLVMASITVRSRRTRIRVPDTPGALIADDESEPVGRR